MNFYNTVIVLMRLYKDDYLRRKKFISGQLVYEKLDRVLFRDDCLHLFLNYVVTNGPFMCSDHAYVFLNTDPHHAPRRGTTFKYQHSWAVSYTHLTLPTNREV